MVFEEEGDQVSEQQGRRFSEVRSLGEKYDCMPGALNPPVRILWLLNLLPKEPVKQPHHHSIKSHPTPSLLTESFPGIGKRSPSPAL